MIETEVTTVTVKRMARMKIFGVTSDMVEVLSQSEESCKKAAALFCNLTPNRL